MKSLLIANWKMNMDIKSSISFINKFKIIYFKKTKRRREFKNGQKDNEFG